jgi:hypothetical protein
MLFAALIQIVIALVILGVGLWAVSELPMDDAIRKWIRVLVIVGVVIYILFVLIGLLAAVGPVYPYPHR